MLAYEKNPQTYIFSISWKLITYLKYKPKLMTVVPVDYYDTTSEIAYTCYSTVPCKVIRIFYYVQIQTIDKQLPVILLAIRLSSLDLKHLIPGNGPPETQG